ncbi:hypothetical protein [Amycolatopsis sp. NBC_00355]|uniref:hypothetical protein n=1 Tax=Amycolatopsis sp. NBC_00355 TaxID=2975957 RepID=UPI003FA47557
MAEWVARWFLSLDLDPRTIESYRSRLRCHILPKFGDLPLGGCDRVGPGAGTSGVRPVDGKCTAESFVDVADRCSR